MDNTPLESAFIKLAKHHPPLGWQHWHTQWQTFPLGHLSSNELSGNNASSNQAKVLRQAAQLVGLPPELGDGSGFSNFVDGPNSVPTLNFISRTLQPSSQTSQPNQPLWQQAKNITDISQTSNTITQSSDSSVKKLIDSTGVKDISRKEVTNDPNSLTLPKLGNFEAEHPQNSKPRDAFNRDSLSAEEPRSTGNKSIRAKDLSLSNEPISALQQQPLGQHQPLGFRRPVITTDTISTDTHTSIQRTPTAMPSGLDGTKPISTSLSDVTEKNITEANITESTDNSPELLNRSEVLSEENLDTDIPIHYPPTITTPDTSVTNVELPTESLNNSTISTDVPPDTSLEQDSTGDVPTIDTIETVSPVQKDLIDTTSTFEPLIDPVSQPRSTYQTDEVTAKYIPPTKSSIESTSTETLDTPSNTVQTRSEESTASPPQPLLDEPYRELEDDAPELLTSDSDLSATPPANQPTAPKNAPEIFSEISPESLFAESPTLDTGLNPQSLSTDRAIIQPKSVQPEVIQPAPEQLDSKRVEQITDYDVELPDSTVDFSSKNIGQLHTDTPGLEVSSPDVLSQDANAPNNQNKSSSSQQLPSQESIFSPLPETSLRLEPTETPDDTIDQNVQSPPRIELPTVDFSVADLTPAPNQIPAKSTNPTEPEQQLIRAKILSDAVTQPLGMHKLIIDDANEILKAESRPVSETVKSKAPEIAARSTIPTIQTKQRLELSSHLFSPELTALTSKYDVDAFDDSFSLQPDPLLVSSPLATAAPALEESIEESPLIETSQTISLLADGSPLTAIAERSTVAHIASGESEDRVLWQLAYLLYSELRSGLGLRSHSSNFQRASPDLMPMQSEISKQPQIPLALWPPPLHQLTTRVRLQLQGRLRQDFERSSKLSPFI